jgi:hypothetical protein
MPTCGLGQRQLALHTANTTWICSSTDTCRDGFCCLLTQPSFPTPQLNPVPEGLTHTEAADGQQSTAVGTDTTDEESWRIVAGLEH